MTLASADPRAAWLMRLGDATLDPRPSHDRVAVARPDARGGHRARQPRPRPHRPDARASTRAPASSKARRATRTTSPIAAPSPTIAIRCSSSSRTAISPTRWRAISCSPPTRRRSTRASPRRTTPETAGIATRSAREMAYHLRHAGEWMIRLGDGTAESHAKAQAALDDLWPYVPELFEADDLDREVAASGFGVDPSTLRGDVRRRGRRRARARDAEEAGRALRPARRQGRPAQRASRPHPGGAATLQRAYPDARW